MGSPQATAPSMNQTILGVVNESLSRQSPGGKALKLCTRDLETLNRYSERTSLTLGNTNTRFVFRNTTLWLAFQVRLPPALVSSFSVCKDSDG